jgi:hypothetical protein
MGEQRLGNYGFGILTAHDLYCKLKREYTKYQGSPTDSDHAWNSVVTAWHVREWVWKERLGGNPGEDSKLFGVSFGTNMQAYNKELNKRCPKYSLFRDLCNGSKHFQLESPGYVSTAIRPGALCGARMYGEGPYNEAPYLAILDNGCIVRFGYVLDQVVSLWDAVFMNEPCI